MRAAPIHFDELAVGRGIHLLGGLDPPDLPIAGYREHELRASGSARSYRAGPDHPPDDGRFVLEAGAAADFATRVVVRRPVDPGRCSGTLVVEWLNVSSGSDAAPAYGFLAPEIVRRGHIWVGVSAQHAGLHTAPALVEVSGGGLAMQGLCEADPDRYGSLRHPGDAFSYDLFTAVARALGRGAPGSPTADVAIGRVLAVGESQSAYALTTYANGVQPVEGLFDGFLIHSRGGPAAPLDAPDGRFDVEAHRGDPPVPIRDDLDVPVLILETETDVLGHLDYLAARQPDTDRLRIWEVAGAAHADRSLVGDFESVLGCPEPVNDGQQRFVVRAALRHLVDWAAGGPPPPTAARLAVMGQEGIEPRFEVDELGNSVGGVRTPCVDVAVEVLSGLASPGASTICRLFGRRAPVPVEELRRRYPSVDDYRERYEEASDAAVAAGFVLADDRDELRRDVRTDPITW